MPNAQIYLKSKRISPYGEGKDMQITDTVDFGSEIRRVRKSLGYTQNYLADFSGLSVSFISDLERGKATVELGKAIRLAQLLGLDIRLEARESA